jgi:signal transduction histidine kinase
MVTPSNMFQSLRDRAPDLVALPIVALSILEATALASQPDLALAASGSAAGLALLLRRRLPLLAPLAAVAVIAASSLGGRHAFWQSNAIVFALLLSAWTLGRHLPLRSALPAAATMVLLVAASQLAAPAAEHVNALFAVVAVAGCWAGAAAIRWRAEQAARLSESSDLVAGALPRQVSNAITAERRRMARELHDVISHTVTVITLQAGGARMLIDADTRRALEAVGVVERAGREALGELRRMGTLFEGGGWTMSVEPGPSLAAVDVLIERARAAGFAVEVVIDGEPTQLDAGLDLTAYRIVQEALTNAVRHGDGTARLSIHHGPERLVVEMVNGLGGSSSNGGGSGLLGMRERAELYGGSLEAGPSGRSFVLRASLPIESDPR